MRCPRCGYVYRTRFAEQVWKIIGLVVAVCTALIGQAEMLGEPWRHYVSIIAIVGTAVLGVVINKSGSGSSQPDAASSPSPMAQSQSKE